MITHEPLFLILTISILPTPSPPLPLFIVDERLILVSRINMCKTKCGHVQNSITLYLIHITHPSPSHPLFLPFPFPLCRYLPFFPLSPSPLHLSLLRGTVEDTELVEGLVLDQKASHLAGGVTRVEKAKIGLIQFCISPPKTDVLRHMTV